MNQYLYDGEGRLCAVYEYSTSRAITGYYYEADGMRQGKGPLTAFTCDLTQNNLTPGNAYAYGPNGEELEEMTGYQLNFSHFNIFLEGELLGTFTGTTYSPANWEYALNDWVGTKRVIANYDGSISTSFFSGPFGDYLNNLGPGSDPSEQHFTGKDRDVESSLDYFGARYYNSNMGRFMTPDPGNIGADPTNPQSWNMYSYGLNNPLKFTDPTCLYCAWEDGTSDDDPSDGGASKGDCNSQGGHWTDQSNPYHGADGCVSTFDWNTPNPSTFSGFASFFGSWLTGSLPSTIYYGPNDPATKQMMATSGVAAARAAYVKKGCPAKADQLPTGGHLGPVGDQIDAALSGQLNYTLMQVGGFNASMSTSDGTTTVTLTNTAGHASFSGASTIGPVAAILSGPQNILGTQNNPLGANGPAHDVVQTFLWTEPSPCP